jgi:hypothetical protein
MISTIGSIKFYGESAGTNAIFGTALPELRLAIAANAEKSSYTRK